MQLRKTLTILFACFALFAVHTHPAKASWWSDLGSELGIFGSSVYGSIDLQNNKYGGKINDSVEFINKLIGFATAVASIWLLVTIIINGMTIINNDKGPEAFNTAAKNIAISVLGLAISSMAFIVTQYVGLAMFGNNSAFTNPLSQVKAPRKSNVDYSRPPTDAEQVFGKPDASLVADEYKDVKGPNNFVSNVVAAIAAAAALWLLYALVWNGIKLITATKADAIETATRNITYSIIGFLIAVMAYVITNYVTTLLLDNNKLLEDPVSEQLLKK